jgi:hypothetical protein
MGACVPALRRAAGGSFFPAGFCGVSKRRRRVIWLPFRRAGGGRVTWKTDGSGVAGRVGWWVPLVRWGGSAGAERDGLGRGDRAGASFF